MTRKSSFMVKVGQLVTVIRAQNHVSKGQACQVLNVGPWQLKHYADAILDLCPDIRFDGQGFSCIQEFTDAKQRRLDVHV